VTVYLPFEPKGDFIAMVGHWLRKNTNKSVLMDIHFDPTVVGGCAVVWNNVYHDFSVHYYLNKHQDYLMDLIKEYGEKKPE